MKCSCGETLMHASVLEAADPFDDRTHRAAPLLCDAPPFDETFTSFEALEVGRDRIGLVLDVATLAVLVLILLRVWS